MARSDAAPCRITNYSYIAYLCKGEGIACAKPYQRELLVYGHANQADAVERVLNKLGVHWCAKERAWKDRSGRAWSFDRRGQSVRLWYWFSGGDK